EGLCLPVLSHKMAEKVNAVSINRHVQKMKVNIICKIALMTLLISALPGMAGQAIYKTTGHATIFGNGQIQSIVTRGFVVLDPDTRRITEIGTFTINGQRVLKVIQDENYRFEQVAGPNGTTNSVIAKAESTSTQFASK